MIEIINDDITTLSVNVIVNAANPSLLGGGGVDGAIHHTAGPALLYACKKLKGCSTGEAKITPGFNLPSHWVIHTVGPIWQGGNQQEPDLLKQCYINVFELAKKNNLSTIAFPAISTGVYGFPFKPAAKIALTTMIEYECHFTKIIACLFSQENKKIYKAIYPSIKTG